MYNICLLPLIYMFVLQRSLVFLIKFEFFSNNCLLLSGIPIAGTQIEFYVSQDEVSFICVLIFFSFFLNSVGKFVISTVWTFQFWNTQKYRIFFRSRVQIQRHVNDEKSSIVNFNYSVSFHFLKSGHSPF